MPDKIRISLSLTPIYVNILDQLVEEGIYLDHQDAIRSSLRIFFRLHGRDPFNPIIKDDPRTLIAESIELMEELLKRIRDEG